MSGIPAHTLRMWERRYGSPRPGRTPGGARRYDAHEVERLGLIAKALELGFRAGDVVNASAAELSRSIAEQRGRVVGPLTLPALEQALQHVRDRDPGSLRAALRVAVATLGARRFVSEFASPLARLVGEGWQAGELCVHQEHMATEALATQLHVLLDAYDGIDARPRVLLTTLEGERHGLGLLMAALGLALRGATPRLLGVSTPVGDIAAAAGAFDADVVGLSFAGGVDERSARQQIRKLRKLLPAATKLWLGGEQAESLGLREGDVELATGAEGVELALTRWRSGR